MDLATMKEVLRILRRVRKGSVAPSVSLIAETGGNPFDILVSCILSLRTRDETTTAVFPRVREAAPTPSALLEIPEARLAKLLYPVGFYRTKARQLRELARILIDEHEGRVPSDIDSLLELPGVGRKTANLVVTLGYRKPGICVDTHVHRISNRFGFVQTKVPDQTEMALRKLLPRRYWIELNDVMVAFGQTICHPTSPHCSTCPVGSPPCSRVGVERSR